MTRADLTKLLGVAEKQADDGTDADRLVLADLLDEHGRDLEAKLLRAVGLPVRLRRGGLVPLLTVDDHGSNDPAPPCQWVNCCWGEHRLGGCWVFWAGGLDDSGQERGPGDVEPYQGWEMTGAEVPNPDYFAALGLDLAEDEAEELCDLLREESERVCAAEVKDLLEQAEVDAAGDES